VFQTYYSIETLSSWSQSDIAWIGSVQSYLLLLVGALTGPIFDAGYFRSLLFTGSFLVVFGMMMTSIASNYWQIFLAQAICVGIGAGCLFVPTVALISTYFTSKITIATGIAASGSGIGIATSFNSKCWD
jgi:MFS family permease